MDLTEYRVSPAEQERINDLLSLMPSSFSKGLDIGTRDGYIAKCMADRCDHVTALDLSVPEVDHEKIECVQGNIISLEFPDDTFDVVLCAEVLEHIPTQSLATACRELVRVTKQYLVIGVPFNQDIRLNSTICPACKKTNPPWGHVNSFDLDRLRELHAPLNAQTVNYIGSTKDRTNFLTHTLMEYAGHPFGTYIQDEPCVYCGAEIKYTGQRTIPQRIATRVGHICQSIQTKLKLTPGQPAWVHILFKK